MNSVALRLRHWRAFRWSLYFTALVLQLAHDLSVSCGAWWAMVQQHEAGWKRKDK